MGFYIETGSVVKGKAQAIVDLHGATKIPTPRSFEEIPDNLALVCVVDNGPFEAAGYCFSASEFEAFTYPKDCRLKEWLTMDKDLAEELVGFNG